MFRNIVFAISQIVVIFLVVWSSRLWLRLGLAIVAVAASSFLYATGRLYQDPNALYFDGNFAAQTIDPEIDKQSGIIKFRRVVEATNKLDWHSTFTYQEWRLLCNGPSEPDYNLWSYGVLRSYGYNNIECRIAP
jgi:hypothetical protein